MEQLIAFASSNGMLSAVWVALVVMILVTTIKMKMSPIKQISTQDLTLLMNREEGVALDIRKEKEFKAGHILDAINLPSEKISKNGITSLEKHKDNSTYRVAIRKTIMARKKAQELMKMAKIAELEARRMECKLINIGEEPLCYWKRKQYGLQYKKRDFIRNTLYDPDEWYDVAISSVSDSGDDDS